MTQDPALFESQALAPSPLNAFRPPTEGLAIQCRILRDESGALLDSTDDRFSTEHLASYLQERLPILGTDPYPHVDIADAYTALASRASVEFYPDAKSVIFNEQDQANHFYLVYEGLVDIRAQHNGNHQQRTIATLKPGMIFGEMGQFHPQQQRSASAITASPNVTVIKIPYAALAELFEKRPEVARLWRHLTDQRQDSLTALTNRILVEERNALGNPDAVRQSSGDLTTWISKTVELLTDSTAWTLGLENWKEQFLVVLFGGMGRREETVYASDIDFLIVPGTTAHNYDAGRLDTAVKIAYTRLLQTFSIAGLAPDAVLIEEHPELAQPPYGLMQRPEIWHAVTMMILPEHGLEVTTTNILPTIFRDIQYMAGNRSIFHQLLRIVDRMLYQESAETHERHQLEELFGIAHEVAMHSRPEAFDIKRQGLRVVHHLTWLARSLETDPRTQALTSPFEFWQAVQPEAARPLLEAFAFLIQLRHAAHRASLAQDAPWEKGILPDALLSDIAAHWGMDLDSLQGLIRHHMIHLFDTAAALIGSFHKLAGSDEAQAAQLACRHAAELFAGGPGVSDDWARLELQLAAVTFEQARITGDQEKRILQASALLAHRSSDFEGIFLKLAERKEIPAGTIMTREGDSVLIQESRQGSERRQLISVPNSDALWLIVEGHVAVQQSGETMAILGPGQSFGQQALSTGGPRQATVEAQSDLVVYELNARAYAALFQHPLAQTELRRIRETLDLLDAWAHQMTPEPLLEWDLFALEKLVATARPQHFAAGERVISQGAFGHTFYIVAQGQVHVEKDGHTIGTPLERGMSFGEIGARRLGLRTSSVVADTDTDVLELDRNVLLTILERYPALQQGLDAQMHQRIEELVRDFVARNRSTTTVLAEFRLLVLHLARRRGIKDAEILLGWVNKELLDIASGPSGELPHILGEQGFRIRGFDISSFDNPLVIEGDMQTMEGIESESVDVAFITNFLHNWTENYSVNPPPPHRDFYEQTAQSIHRVLRPGGVLYLITGDEAVPARDCFREAGLIEMVLMPGVYELQKPEAPLEPDLALTQVKAADVLDETYVQPAASLDRTAVHPGGPETQALVPVEPRTLQPADFHGQLQAAFDTREDRLELKEERDRSREAGQKAHDVLDLIRIHSADPSFFVTMISDLVERGRYSILLLNLLDLLEDLYKMPLWSLVWHLHPDDRRPLYESWRQIVGPERLRFHIESLREGIARGLMEFSSSLLFWDRSDTRERREILNRRIAAGPFMVSTAESPGHVPALASENSAHTRILTTAGQDIVRPTLLHASRRPLAQHRPLAPVPTHHTRDFAGFMFSNLDHPHYTFFQTYIPILVDWMTLNQLYGPEIFDQLQAAMHEMSWDQFVAYTTLAIELAERGPTPLERIEFNPTNGQVSQNVSISSEEARGWDWFHRGLVILNALVRNPTFQLEHWPLRRVAALVRQYQWLGPADSGTFHAIVQRSDLNQPVLRWAA